MKNFLYAFMLFFTALTHVSAEKLPALTPLGSPMAIAETILDAPDEPTQKKRAVKTKNAPKLAQTGNLPEIAQKVDEKPKTAPQNIENSISTKEVQPEEKTLAPAPTRATEITKNTKATIASEIKGFYDKLHFYGSVDAHEQALHTANYILNHHPNHVRAAEALFYVATLSPDQTHQGKALQRLKVQFRDSVWSKEAAYSVIWQHAQQNKLTSLFSDPRAKKLKQRQESLPQINTIKRITLALSLIPGAGFAYLGEFDKAAFYFIAAGLLIWALTFAVFWAQLPYAVLCAFALISLFTHNIISTQALAEAHVAQKWQKAFTEWTDLKPLKAYQILEESF